MSQWPELFANKNYRIGETYNMKGDAMNSDDRLECLRLAIEWAKFNPGCDVKTTASIFYNWVHEDEKPNRLTFEKINKERE